MFFRINTQQIKDTLSGLGLSKKHSALIAQGVGAAALATWKQLALNELKSTSRDYVDGLSMSRQKNTVTITLNGTLPNLIEQGFAGGNMRQWMLSSPKAKQMKGGVGVYLVVPFRHGVPSTRGRNVGQPMPKEIYKAAKQLAATTSMVIERPGQPLRAVTSWGGRLTPDLARTGKNRQGLQGLDLTPKARQQVRQKLNELMRPWHTTSVWTGMVRNEAMYEKVKQSSYTTFRVISSRQKDPRSWMHPGIQAKHFVDRVQDKIADILSDVVANVIRGNEDA